MHAIVFANGSLHDAKAARGAAQAADYIITANGGTTHCLALGLWPDLVVGDYDSLDADVIVRLKAHGSVMVRHAVHKDHSDLELALMEAVRRRMTAVTIFGGLGARWDMSLINLLMPAHPAFSGLFIELVDQGQRIRLITPPRPARFRSKPGATLSLIPIGGNAAGIETSGLLYPLHRETLQFGSSRGVSNVLLGNEARVSLTSGFLLAVLQASY